MARTAKPEADEVTEIIQPDFERALRIMTNDVHPQIERDAKARGELASAWKAIEDECHCNKAAAKFYFKLTGMSDEKRDDVLRSLFGLMKHGNMGITQDLVDRMAAGEAPTMPIMPDKAAAELVTLQ